MTAAESHIITRGVLGLLWWLLDVDDFPASRSDHSARHKRSRLCEKMLG